MSDLLSNLHDNVYSITLNRIDKHNAFDNVLLADLQQELNNATNHPDVRVIVIKANGAHFSAGADLNWMKKMAQFSEDENLADAQILAQLMHTLYQSPIPTIAMVQGAAMGGGAGIVAACDIAIASYQSRFCFSEVKLGLIPAVISPYVIKAIGERAATWLFTSAETIDAKRALELQLIHYCTTEEDLLSLTLRLAQQISRLAPQSVRDAKSLVRHVAKLPINQATLDYTSTLIAKKRVSEEGQKGLQFFLNKEIPHWD